MNGQICAVPTPSAPSSAPGDEDAALIRLYLALIISCFLHALMLLLPYFGTSSLLLRSSVANWRQSAQVLQVRLTTLAVPGKTRFVTLPPKPGVPPESTIARPTPTEAKSIATPKPPEERSHGADLLPIPAPVYYTTDQLTKRPQPIGSAELETPILRHIIASGKIVLKLWISNLGEVSTVEIVKSDMPEAFSQQALAAFRQLRFEPGERNGLPVGTLITIEVNYDDGRLRSH